MSDKILVDKELLVKFAKFTKLAMTEISRNRRVINSSIQKQAEEQVEQDKYNSILVKAAKAMYNSDFINDEEEYRSFIKKAKADVSYLANTLIKVCNASDVMSFGKPANVGLTTKKAAAMDPVYARAFGYKQTHEQEQIIDLFD